MKRLYQVRLLRRLFLPLLERCNPGDITIRHHRTGDKVTLHTFKHKDYWYHGKRRKQETMRRYAGLIQKEDCVIEIGAHIGYVSLYLAHLVGPNGHVVAFEPAPGNFAYLQKNTASHPWVSIVAQAVTNYVGSAGFYLDARTGQNSALVEIDSTLANGKRATAQSTISVSCTRLDRFLRGKDLPPPSFVKIDIEGAEFFVLSGMQETLRRSGLALMVEVTTQESQVWSLLKEAGFLVFRPDGRPVDHMGQIKGDLFCVREDDDRAEVFSSPTQRMTTRNNSRNNLSAAS